MGLRDAGASELGGAAEAVPGFSEESLKGSALRGACLYDRNSAGKEVWGAFRAEYVYGIRHDGSGCF